MQAQTVIEKMHPDVHLDVEAVTTTVEMLQFTQVIAFPSLMIDKKLVCVGRYPAKEEILDWLETAAQEVKSRAQIKI